MLVVNLIPLLLADILRFQVMVVQERNDTQHVFIILIITHALRISLQEGHILLPRELTRELIDVHGLVITACVGIVKGLFRNEVHDVAVLIYLHHRAVHPRLIAGHQGHIGVFTIHEHRNQPIGKNQVTLDKQRVIFLQLFLHQRQRVDIVRLVIHQILSKLYLEPSIVAATDVIHQFLAFIAYHDDHPLQVCPRQLLQQTVNQPYAIHRHHALRIILCIFSEPASHASCQYYCLHRL